MSEGTELARAWREHPDWERMRAMSETWEAIVVGAGPAGSSLAIQLAQRGIRVVLIDRDHFPRDKLCGEFLSPECWPMLDRLGVSRSIELAGFHPIRQLRVCLPEEHCLTGVLAAAEDRPAIGLSRSRLDNILLRRAAEVGAAVCQRVQVAGVIRRDGSVIGVRTQSASAGRRRSRTEAMFAKVVVAADGRRSLVVRHSGRGRAQRPSTPGAVCAVKRHFRVSQSFDPAAAIELHSFPGGYGGTCRIEGGLINLCTLVPTSVMRQARGDIDRALHRMFRHCRLDGWLADAEPVGDWKSIPAVALEQSRPSLAGVLYVGDARGTIDPLGGEGMSMALEGAELVARFIEQAVSQRTGCDRGLQQEYDSTWLRRFSRRVQLCQGFSWLLSRPRALKALAAVLPQGIWRDAILPLAFRVTRGAAGHAAAPIRRRTKG
jgi:flavin-dependent dehydrogenase